MRTFDTHVCLVSDQAMANLLPALDVEFKPASVVLVVSNAMKQQAVWLETVLKQRGCKVSQIAIGDAYDLFAIRDQLLGWLGDHATESLALNVTGGTKLMAIAAQEVFGSDNRPIFYVNVATDELFMLGDRHAKHKLAASINLKDFLAAHGYTIFGSDKPQPKKVEEDLTDRLVGQVAEFGRALGRLNQLAADARVRNGEPRPQKLSYEDLDSSRLSDLLDYFEEARVLKVQGDRLIFSDEKARTFANGGWLELHVYRVLAQIAGETGISSHATSIEVRAPDGKTSNEIDAAFLHANRLHIIECKTANLGRVSKGNDTKATDAIYKLETLLKMGGLRTRGALIDYRGGLSDADKARAAQSHIRIFSGNELPHLGGHLKAWVNESR